METLVTPVIGKKLQCQREIGSHKDPSHVTVYLRGSSTQYDIVRLLS